MVKESLDKLLTPPLANSAQSALHLVPCLRGETKTEVNGDASDASLSFIHDKHMNYTYYEYE